MYRSGLVDTLVTHANTKGFGLTSLSGVSHAMPPQFKKKMNSTQLQSKNYLITSTFLTKTCILMALKDFAPKVRSR